MNHAKRQKKTNANDLGKVGGHWLLLILKLQKPVPSKSMQCQGANFIENGVQASPVVAKTISPKMGPTEAATPLLAASLQTYFMTG